LESLHPFQPRVDFGCGAFAQERQARERATRHHAEGRQVKLWALSDYDVLFSSDFTAAGAKVTS
jgi:hypothetical protein